VVERRRVVHDAEVHDAEVGGAVASWPAIFRAGPRALVAGVVAFLLVTWLAVIVVDVVLPRGDVILWMHLFNDRPVEWAQWLLLPAAAVSAGYLAARLPDGEAARFFLLFAVGVSLMLVEDAGDVRHVISDYVVDQVGGRVRGVRTRTVSDLVYFALLAAVPVYALLRYGRSVWRVRAVRGYLAGGYGLYAVAAIGSGLSGLGLYQAVGRFVADVAFAGRLALPTWAEPGWSHFFIADSALEETIETLAAGLMLGLVLAYAEWFRTGVATPVEAPAREDVTASP
jgi:hypothetical protein